MGDVMMLNVFFEYLHRWDDLIRSEDQRSGAYIIFNQLLIKNQLLSASNYLDYSKIGFRSQGHCFEYCVLNAYVEKHNTLTHLKHFRILLKCFV